MNKLLTKEQAAHFLAVHPDTIRNLIRRGELPVTRIGRAVRVSQESLNSYVKQNTTQEKQEYKKCHTKEKGRRTGGYHSDQIATAKKLENLLGL